jgi:hypothetical protein
MTGLWERDCLAYLGMLEGYLSVARAAPERRIAALDALGSADARIEALPKYCVLTRMLVPALGRVFEVDVTMAARLECARAALTVERYRAAEGGLPEKLEDLVPKYLEAVPTDPFDGKPLRYRRLEKGYMIYSVGPDRMDNGGAEREGRAAAGWDVTFTVER